LESQLLKLTALWGQTMVDKQLVPVESYCNQV